MAKRRITRWGVLSVAAAGVLLLFSSTAVASPANDDFSMAQDLGTSLPASATGNTAGAGAESGEPAHGGVPAAHSVWYRWQAPATEAVKVNICEGTSDTGSHDVAIRLAVYTGGSLSGLALVAGNGDGSDSCSVTFNAAAGVSYDLVVDPGDGRSDVYFTLRLHAIEPAPNDDLADAQEIPPDSATTIPGTTLGATAEPGEPAHAGVAAERSIWYLWTPAEDSKAFTDVCGSEVGVRLAVYTTPGLARVADNGSYGDCRIAWQAHAGKTYAIALDSGDVEGDTALSFFSGDPDSGASNDNFSQAEQLGASGGFTLDGATAEDGEPAHDGRPATKSVWSKYTAPFGGVATIGTCGNDPVRMAVYTGTQLQALTPVADNRADRDCVLQFLIKKGVQYDIAFDSFGAEGDAGGYSFDAYPFPPNDQFADAQPLSIDPNTDGSVDGTTRGATAEAGEPDHSPGVEAGYSVWYRWTAPRTERVTFDTCAEFHYIDTLLAVYEGSSLSSLSPLGNNDDGPTCDEADSGNGNPVGSQVMVNVVAGHEYRIAVDSYDMGDFRLRISYAGPSTDASQQPPPPALSKRKSALKKCKKKHSKKARKKCRKRALKLSV
jgi:hypothetical protein